MDDGRTVLFLTREDLGGEDWVPALAGAADELWVSSAALRASCLEAGADPQRTAIVPLGVDPVRFHPRSESNRGSPFRVLVLVGRSLDAAMEAYGLAFGSSEDGALVPVEPIDSIRTSQMYATCDCFLCLDSGEGASLLVLEAMACGLPVVAADTGSLREICDASTVYLVSADDSAAAARALMRIVKHPDEAEARGVAASARVLRDRTWRSTAAVVAERAAALARR
jgi:glycosyltransferase involved in cell wall biosynthesis